VAIQVTPGGRKNKSRCVLYVRKKKSEFGRLDSRKCSSRRELCRDCAFVGSRGMQHKLVHSSGREECSINLLFVVSDVMSDDASVLCAGCSTATEIDERGCRGDRRGDEGAG
jgi:hypothetical protein